MGRGEAAGEFKSIILEACQNPGKQEEAESGVGLGLGASVLLLPPAFSSI